MEEERGIGGTYTGCDASGPGPTRPPLSKGEYLVGITFNPGNNPTVDILKRKAADFIDTVEALRNGEEAASKAHADQVARLKSLAITHIEDAAMWAVKAATKPT